MILDQNLSVKIVALEVRIILIGMCEGGMQKVAIAHALPPSLNNGRTQEDEMKV